MIHVSNKVNLEIKDIDISDITGASLISKDGKEIHVSSYYANFCRILKKIIQDKGKNIFEPNELKEIFEYMLNNYFAQVDESMYKKNVKEIGEFVEKGGEIKLFYKEK